MGNWRNNKDVEIPLDGVGGVNILVKADVHRSGTCRPRAVVHQTLGLWLTFSIRYQLPALRFRKPSRNRGLREDGAKSRLWRLWFTELCRLARRYGREARECVMSCHVVFLRTVEEALSFF